jgi:hypothetical protein
MLGWIFKKTDDAAAHDAKPQPAASAPGAGTAKERPDDEALWQARLVTAAGNDAALLDIARRAPSIAVKCAAVEALGDEAGLKQAEREFRTHDRRVHRTAKLRHDAAVAQRLARERAGALIETATALLAETTIPTNRLVELDRAWQALEPGLLADTQKATFAELSTQLTQLTQQRGERERQAQRWLAAAREALAKLDAACALAANGDSVPGDLAGATAAAQAATANAPDSGSAAALQTNLQQALRMAADIEARLELLRALQQSPAPAPLPDEPPAADPLPSALARWQALPPMAEGQNAAAMHRRFEQWQASVAAAARAAAPEKPAPRKAAQQLERQAEKRERAQAVDPMVQQAEAALEAGNLAETHRHLVAVDAAVAGGAVPEPLRARLQAVQAEYARLKGWQHWGGGRARDDLVVEAQTLATATTAAVADPKQAAKLPIKQLADAIDDLRKRWKELDRLGGATNQTLWHNFDAALKTAFEPVAAHLDQLKAKRKENLAVRFQLLGELDAVRVGDDDGTAQAGADESSAEAPDQAIDWREPARALGHFQTEWRKLGPVEHTVPHKSRDALMARMQASVARIEAPLNAARRAAQQVREQLVARAKALGQEALANPHGRDLVLRVRELQEQWQQHARTLPLARQVENALWAEFKAATDAVFAQRDAAFSARDAELLANLANRDTLVTRLEALTTDTPSHEFKRTLAEIDAEWRQPVDVPRQQVAGLDARFRAARQAAQQVLTGSAQRLRQARFDALTARLALCEELERHTAGGSPTPDDLVGRWAAQAPAQTAWEQALDQRWQHGTEFAAGASPSGAADVLDAVLLQLESALDAPSPPAYQAARRDMKLRAMKVALESRSTARAAPASIDELMAAALRHPLPSALQSERLHALIAALRARDPDRA